MEYKVCNISGWYIDVHPMYGVIELSIVCKIHLLLNLICRHATGIGGQFVKGITGDFFAVMGFPMHRFSWELARILNE